jgi:hypothetical protein
MSGAIVEAAIAVGLLALALAAWLAVRKDDNEPDDRER